MNTLLPTTIVGSLPKPSWLSEPEKLWSPWKLHDGELREGKLDAQTLAVHDQSLAGLDIISDGEQTRQHFVTTFIEHLGGVDFDRRETVRIRDRYDASVPTVVGPVSREESVFAEDAKRLRADTDRPIKWALPGPMTMIDTLYDDHYRSREQLAWEFATILNQEAKDLEAAGVDIIQIDEPAFNVFFDELKDWGCRSARACDRRVELQDRRSHLLWLRHQGKHRLEGDAGGGRMAPVRRVVPTVAAVIDRHRVAGESQLAGTCRGDRTASRKDRHAGSDRRGRRRHRDAGGSRRHFAQRPPPSSTRTSSTPAGTAAWRRSLVASHGRRWSRSPRAPAFFAESSPDLRPRRCECRWRLLASVLASDRAPFINGRQSPRPPARAPPAICRSMRSAARGGTSMSHRVRRTPSCRRTGVPRRWHRSRMRR